MALKKVQFYPQEMNGARMEGDAPSHTIAQKATAKFMLRNGFGTTAPRAQLARIESEAYLKAVQETEVARLRRLAASFPSPVNHFD